MFPSTSLRERLFSLRERLFSLRERLRKIRVTNKFMAYMYILECADGSYYTGSTKDLERRLWQHQQGEGANHTAKRLPVKLVFCEYYDRVVDAFEREKQVQGWNRRKKQALIAGNTNLLHQLAECQNETHYRNAP
jgi:putative endonuclease